MQVFVILSAITIQVLLITSNVLSDNVCSEIESHECMEKYMENLKKILILIFPNISILNLNAFQTKYYAINHTISNEIQFIGSLNNLEFSISELKYNNIRIDRNSLEGHFKIELSLLKVKFDYSADNTKILKFVIKNNGTARFETKNSSVSISYKLEEIEKGGIKYYATAKLRIGVSIGELDVKIDTHDKHYQSLVNFALAQYLKNPKVALAFLEKKIEDMTAKIARMLLIEVFDKLPAAEFSII